MMWRIVVVISIILATTLIVRAQFQVNGEGVGAPGTPSSTLQFNTNGVMGGISGVTSDSANVGFATSSNISLYGLTATTCLQLNAAHQIVSSGGACGGSGAPGGVNGNLQFNTNGSLGGISGANSTDASTVRFNTNSLVINGQAISGVSGTTGTLATVTGSLTTNCIKADGSGNLIDSGTSCGGGGGGTTTSIVAGTNITTSGVATNTTVNVVATPSFTTVIASGNITAGTAQFTGAVSGTTAQFQTYTGSIINLNGTASITASTIQLSGLLTASTGNFSGLTVQGLNGCVQANTGLFITTGVNCATQVTTVSIAAGNNITTSGTASNVTVTATPTGPSNTVQFNNAGVFGGDNGFQYGGGSSGIVTHSLGTVTTTNSKALSLIGTWSNSTTTFAAPLFINVITNTSSANTTSGFGVGSRLVDIQATSLSVLSISPSGSISSAALQSSATQCLQASSGGLVFGTAVPCATQTSTPSIAAGSNITTSGTAANTTVNVVATPSFTTVIASGNLTAATAQFAGFLTAGGASLSGLTIQTETLSSNLTGTSANFSTNLTANVAQFAGFLSAGGGSLSGLTIATETLSGNLTGTSANFSTNLTANIAQFAGFMSAGGSSLSGLTIQTGTFSGNLTGTSANFSTNLTANIAQFAGFMSAGGASLSGLTIQTETLTGNLTGTTANFSSVLTASMITGTPTGAGLISFISPGVAQFVTSGTAVTPTGWLNWGGESRVSANPFLTVTVATLTPIGLSVNIQGGRTYSVEADIYVGTSINTGGIQAALTGSYGSSNTTYFGYVVDGGSNNSAAGASNPIRGATLATAKNSVVANTNLSGPTGWLKITGTVSASSSGTLTVQAAQNTANSTHPLTITQGSRLIVHDMP